MSQTSAYALRSRERDRSRCVHRRAQIPEPRSNSGAKERKRFELAIHFGIQRAAAVRTVVSPSVLSVQANTISSRVEAMRGYPLARPPARLDTVMAGDRAPVRSTRRARN